MRTNRCLLLSIVIPRSVFGYLTPICASSSHNLKKTIVGRKSSMFIIIWRTFDFPHLIHIHVSSIKFMKMTLDCFFEMISDYMTVIKQNSMLIKEATAP